MTSSSVSPVAGRDPRVVFARHGAGEGSNEFQRERNLRLAVCDWFAITPGRIQIHHSDGTPRYTRDGHPVTRSDGGRQEARQLADRLLATIEVMGDMLRDQMLTADDAFRAVCGTWKMRDSIDAMVDERLTALDAVARS